jgi:predicted phage terminase large subunit-like protein
MFDLDAHLANINPRLLSFPEGRRVLTELDPLLFALTYLPHHLRGQETGDVITFSDFHLESVELAKRYVKPIGGAPAQLRDALIAPRGVGKSTWWFTIIPLWLAAHGHRQFIAAFASSATQASDHLTTFKNELQNNELLRSDFPDLCAPARRPTGVTVSDSQSMYIARSGFVFVARGIDSANLGLKIGTRRPDHLVLDDIEGTEGSYTPTMKKHRLATLLSGILPLNVYASVTMAGTVAIPGAIIDDVAAKQRGESYPGWVDEENFTPRYFPAIVSNEDGTERSLWPEKWSMAYMDTVRHTRQFRSQMMNDPMAADTAFWSGEDFAYRDDVAVTHQVLSIDPAVTTKAKSDYTALAVIAYSRTEDVCVVRDAWQVKIPPGEKLRARVLQILDTYPDIGGVVVETNQGGDAWLAILHDLPVTVRTVSQSRPKEVRAGSLLAKYQRGRVFHEKRLHQLQAQMLKFPLDDHDDLVDAVGTGVEVFLKNDKRPRVVRAREAGGLGEGGDDDE